MTRDVHDLAGGAALAALGLGVAGYAALRWDIGAPSRMGPGFFPAMLGGLLAALGLVIAAPALRRPGQSRRFAGVELAATLAAIAIFALGLEPLGLLLVTPLAVLVASAAAPRGGVVWRVVLALCVTVIATLVFHLGLKMSVPLLPVLR